MAEAGTAAGVSVILRADARNIPLADGCVQTCVTSPPYWGLRDYGTARWEGGEAGCDHKIVGNPAKSQARSTLAGSKENCGNALSGFKESCGRCGARRIDRQIGLEATPEEYVATMVGVFREVRRVLRDDGTVWLNLGDSYASAPVGSYNGGGNCFVGRDMSGVATSGSFNKAKAAGLKPKDLCGIPWRVAFALQADGWYLRSDIIWAKPNPMPESVTDRPTRSHEYIFLLAKSQTYFYDADAIKEPQTGNTHARGSVKAPPKEAANAAAGNGHKDWCRYVPDGRNLEGGRNKRSVWTINSEPTPEAHFATFPQKLIEPCILAGSRAGDLVLDPFLGSGTVGKVCERLGRRWVGLELSADYISIAEKRTAQMGLTL